MNDQIDDIGKDEEESCQELSDGEMDEEKTN